MPPAEPIPASAGIVEAVTLDATTPLRPERLLAHAAWIRRLAARIVRDAADAEDVAQSTLLEALRRRPAVGADPRGWLARVAHRVAGRMRRGDARREAREQAVARTRSTSSEPPADEALIRASLQRSVVDAVIRLAEPYRTAILLRYLDELPTRTVAKRLGVPVETVRTRLKRGLAQLREALAREVDVERADGRKVKGLAAVALLLEPTSGGGGALTVGSGAKVGAAAGALGALAMTLKLKLALAAVVAAAGAIAAASLLSRGGSHATSRAGDHGGAGSVAAASAAVGTSDAPESAEATRAVDERSPAPANDASPAASFPVIVGIVRDSSGAPVADALVGTEPCSTGGYLVSLDSLCRSARSLFHEPLRRTPPPERQRGAIRDSSPWCTRSAADGSFEVPRPPDSAINLAAVHRERGLALRSGVPIHADELRTVLDLSLEPGLVVKGRITDAQGAPIRGARVSFFGPPGSLDDFESDDDGAYRSLPQAWTRLRIAAFAEGFVGNTGVDVEAPAGVHEVVHDFRLEPAESLRGRIVGGNHAPLPPRSLGVEMEVLGFKIDPRTEKSPRLSALFGARIEENGDWILQLSSNDLHWIALFVGARMFDVAPITPGEAGPDLAIDEEAVAALLPAGALQVSVVDAARAAPVPDYEIEFKPQTHSLPPAAYDFAKKRKVSAADGTVVARDLIADTWYWVTVRVPGSPPRTISAQAGAAEPPPAVTVDWSSSKCCVRGRITDEESNGIGACMVHVIDRRGDPFGVDLGNVTFCDAEGSFEIGGLPEGEWFIVAAPPRLPRESKEVRFESAALPVRLCAGSTTSPVRLRLRRAMLVHAVLRCTDPAVVGPFSFRILDGQGARIRDDTAPLRWCEGYASKMDFPLYVAPGRYTLEVLCRSTKPAHVEFDAAPDAKVVVEVAANGR
jgi:RNA polymerase sigma-70 factor (ECF subfamily)